MWADDRTADFVLDTQALIAAPDGQLILPRLFRRGTAYPKSAAKGFNGNLAGWLLTNEAIPSRSENDRVVVNGTVELRRRDLLRQENRHRR